MPETSSRQIKMSKTRPFLLHQREKAHIMSPNHPRGQRSHVEIINRNAKGMVDRKTDFEKKKIIVIYR